MFIVLLTIDMIYRNTLLLESIKFHLRIFIAKLQSAHTDNGFAIIN